MVRYCLTSTPGENRILEMIIGVLALLITIILILLIKVALNADSKECDFEVEFNLKGFRLSLKTKKNAPSNRKR